MRKLTMLLTGLIVVTVILTACSNTGNPAAAGPAASNTPTVTPTANACTTIDFEEALPATTWAATPAVTAVAYSSATGYNSTNSLAILVDLQGGTGNGSVLTNLSAPVDLDGATVSVWVYIPQTLLNALTGVFPTGDWIAFNTYFSDGTNFEVGLGYPFFADSTAGWTKFEVLVNQSNFASLNASAVTAIGLYISFKNATWAGTLYADDFKYCLRN